MSAEENLVTDGLAMIGAELDDGELDRRVIGFRSALRLLRDDPAETARINELVMDAERAQLDVKTTGSETGEPILGEAGIFDRLAEREKTARQERYRVLGAVIGFATLTLVMLAVSPTFGIPFTVAAVFVTGIVAAVAVRIHSSLGSGNIGGDPLLDSARSIVHRSLTYRPADDSGVIRYLRSDSAAQDSGGWPSAQRHPSHEAASSPVWYGSGQGSDPREGPGIGRELPFGPEISWPAGFRQVGLDPVTPGYSDYGEPLDEWWYEEMRRSGPGYPQPPGSPQRRANPRSPASGQQPAVADYGYRDPGDKGGETVDPAARPQQPTPRPGGGRHRQRNLSPDETGMQPPVPAMPSGKRNRGQSTGQYGVSEVMQRSGDLRASEVAPSRERM